MEPGRATGNGASPHPAPRTPGRLPTPRQLDRWRAIQQAKRHGFVAEVVNKTKGLMEAEVKSWRDELIKKWNIGLAQGGRP